MAVKAAPTLPKLKAPKMPALPKLKPPVIKGPPVAKIKPSPVFKQARIPTDPYAPRKALARAAAGASAVSGKRNPNYPTP